MGFKLSEEQQAAVAHNEGNMLILACAGSGKTTVITRRITRLISDRGISPDNIVAITFTVKAAEHMRDEIVKLLVDKNAINKLFVGTIHAFCLQMQKIYYTDKPDFDSVISEDQQYLILYKHYREWGIEGISKTRSKKRDIGGILKTINLIKAERIFIVDVQRDNLAIADIYQQYNDYLHEWRLFDFADLQQKMLDALERDPEFLTFVRTKSQFLIIDEYQDVDPIQELIIEKISGMQNVCVVGDDDQCIYKFRGTDLQNIFTFERKFGAITYPLTENRRCSTNILKLAKTIIEQNTGHRLPKQMQTTRAGGVVEIQNFGTIHKEARFIIQKIQELHNQGVPFGEMAILLRSVSSSGFHYIDALKRNGIPFIAKGDCGLFTSPAITAIASVFEFLIQSEETCSLFDKLQIGLPITRILAKISKVDIPLTKREFLRLGVSLDDAKILESIMNLRGDVQSNRFESIMTLYFNILTILNLVPTADSTTLANLGEYSHLIHNFEEIEYNKNLKGFVAFSTIYAKWNLDEASPEESAIDAVKISTIHQSKGLDYEVVFCPMLVDRRFPILHNTKEHLISESIFDSERYHTDIYDERRLFYVALTRATNFLYLTKAHNIGLKHLKKPSKFFYDAKRVTFGIPVKIFPSMRMIPEPFPIETSYTQLEYYFSCPYRYLLHVKSGILHPEKPFFQFGQAIHRVLRLINERAMTGDPITPAWIRDTYENEFYMSPSVPRGTILIQKARGLRCIEDYVKENQTSFANVLFTEKDFTFVLHNDRIIGRFDLVKRIPPDSIEIVDFKTGRHRDYLLPEIQMQLYALAANDFFQQRVVKCSLYYVEHNEILDIPITPQVLDTLKARVVDALDAIRNKQFPATPGPQCGRCEYKIFCPFVERR